MELKLKRLLPRNFIDWRGQYMIEDDPEASWRECRVIDVSTFGAGLELVDATPDETAGRSIVLADNLRGEVRHAIPAKSNGVRVGIEFVDLTEAEQTYLTSLVQLQAAW
ncbi:MAG TPA: PilZ domain-containing protein [Acidimicrobiales bacterium]|nr:PilZ domain-containing protein [Acidimicrobiales bacterium]